MTTATSGPAKAVPTTVVCATDTGVIVVPVRGTLVSAKLAGASPATAPCTVNVPAVPLAVIVVEATPDAFVGTTVVRTLPGKLPDAPVGGDVNVTFTPGTLLPHASLTVTSSVCGKSVPVSVVCGVPAATRVAGAPGRLVSVKLAGVATPATVAVAVHVPSEVFA